MTKLKRVIAEEYRDIDGYWIYLVPGWHYDGVHGIVEDTKREARQKARWSEPCDCDECLEFIAKEACRA